MSAVYIVIVCLLASVGMAQVIGWLVMLLRKTPASGRALQVVPLCSDPEELEAQLRYELFLLRWNASPRPRHVILLDPGLDEEGRRICRNLLCDAVGVMVCAPEELEGLAGSLLKEA